MRLEQRVIEADIPTLQAMMEAGEISSLELVQIYIERMGRYDRVLRSILEINPDALAIAEQLDKERSAQGRRGMLHGIPIVLKDNIDTGDSMHTSAGALALSGSIAPKDSYVASQLRKAGAVLLAKANMTEWANFMSDTMWAGATAQEAVSY